MSDLTTKPFQASLSALALIAQREAGAAGYAFFQRDRDGKLTRQDQGGAEIRESDVVGASTVDTYPLGNGDGILALVFDGREHRKPGSILEAIAAVWTAARRTGQYSQLANELADLEARLMDSKIADRASGLSGHPDPVSIEAISRHVESVLRPLPARRALEQLSRDLEQEVEERRLANQAKTILRSFHGMSEEEAHAHLRKASRQSRRPLREIAVEVIDRHTIGTRS